MAKEIKFETQEQGSDLRLSSMKLQNCFQQF